MWIIKLMACVYGLYVIEFRSDEVFRKFRNYLYREAEQYITLA